MVDPIRLAIGVAAVAVAALWPLWQIIWNALRQWRLLKNVPGPPPTHWLLGHVQDFLAQDAPMRFAGYAKQYGGLYRMRFFYAFGVIATDPALVRAVLQSSKTYVPKNREVMKPLELANGLPIPNIVTSSDGDYWRIVRGAWMKCFTSTNLKRILPVLQDICQRVTEQIQDQAAAAPAAAADPAAHQGTTAQPAAAAAPVPAPPAGAAAAVRAAIAAGEAEAAVATAAAGSEPTAVTAADAVVASVKPPVGSALINICNVTDRVTLDVIGHISYGRDFGAVNHKRSRYLELVTAMLALMHEQMDHPLRRMLRKLRGGDRKKALLQAEWDATNAAEVMKAVAEPPGEHTIAGQLMAVRDPASQRPLSQQQLQAELVTATLAGFETTSNALSWTLGSLAAHPHALAALEQELDAAGLLASPANPTPPRFEWQNLGKLSYLQACIREGLRLFSPAAQGSWRLCTTADITISKDFTLPKGTAVGIPWFAFGHNPSTYGPDTEAFRPERWLVGKAMNMNSMNSMGSTDAMNMNVNSVSSADEGDAAGPAAGSTGSAGSDTASPAAAAAAVQRVSSSKQLQDPWTFSIGPRDCAGQALARLELQVVIATLVGNFSVKLAPEVGGWEGLLARRMFHTTLQVKGGLPLLLMPRV